MRRLAPFLSLFGFLLNIEGADVIELTPYTVVAPSLLPIEDSVPGETLRESKPLDLATLLSSELPSIALSRKSPLAGDIVMRGLTRDNILITVDNTKTFCACPNRMDPPAFHVSSQQIEAIQIRKGPFSVKQGSTVGGTVFVRTSPAPLDTTARAYLFAGSYSYLAAGLSAGAPLNDGQANWQIGAYHQQGDVFEDGNGLLFTRLPGTNFRDDKIDTQAFKVLNLESKLSLSLPDDSVVTFNYALQDARDVLYPGLKMDALTDTLNRGAIGYTTALSSGVADVVNLGIAFSTVDHDMQDSFRTSSMMNPAFAERGFMMRTTSKTAYYGLTAEARKDLDGSVISYGFDLMERRWDANNTIMMLQNDMLPDVRVRSSGIWAVLERASGPLRYETGLRIDHASSLPQADISFVQALRDTSTRKVRDTMGSAYFLLQYDLNESLELLAGFGHGERLPDPQERYLNLNRPTGKPDWVGNPDLNPVSNSELQIGGRYKAGNLSASFSAFHGWLQDYIYLSRIQGVSWQATSYTNINARLYGASADLSVQLAPEWFFRSAVAWQEGVKSSAGSLSTTDHLAEVPPLKASFFLTWNPNPLSFRLSASFQDNLDRVDPDLHEQPIGSSWVFNFAAHWSLNPHLSLSAGVENIFDKSYAVANSHLRDPFSNAVIVHEPGRFFFFRLSYEY